MDLLHAVPVYRILLAGGDTSKVGDVPSRVVPLLLAGAGAQLAIDVRLVGSARLAP